MFEFPVELGVKIEERKIEVNIPKLPGKVKDEMLEWEFQPNPKIVIRYVPRTKCTKSIIGGTKELRLKYLLCLLEKLGLFTAPPPLEEVPEKEEIPKKLTIETSESAKECQWNTAPGNYIKFI